MSRTLTLLSLILIIISLAICGTTYTRWSEMIKIKGKVKMGDLCVRIGSCKVLVENKSREEAQLAYGNPVKIWIEGSEEGGVWVGLVIANDGSIPAYIRYDIDLPKGFLYETYFYGPYKRGIPHKVWAFWDGSVVEGYSNEPPNLNKGYKFVAWYHITWNQYINGTQQYESKIVYRTWFTLWSMTNKVLLYFKLTGNHTEG